MKTLQDILYRVRIEGIFGRPSIAVTSLSLDSRTLKQGALYIAQKGTQLDGHDFISQAIKNGARSVICESLPKMCEEGITYVVVNNSAQALGVMASNFYDNPSEKLQLIGITGTNGKTSISSLLYKLFSLEGYSCGLLSTVSVKYADKEFQATHTTPDAITLNKYFKEMIELGVSHCFMEVSSHGIAQHRIEGLEFAAGVFTNLTHDHLDYHKTFKNYRDTKKLFFDALPKTAFALTNLDDKNGGYMLQNTQAKKYSYALRQHADYKTQILECQFTGMLLKIQNQEVWTSLVGNFNAQNLLAVYAIADLFNLPSIDILKQISKLKSVEGRFQSFQTEGGVTVIIDYAHTPDALAHVLETINTIRTRNQSLFTLLGCGGNRDHEKRPKMGQIAAELSDKVIFTSDNPREEDPATIISQMIEGVPAEHYKKILKVTLREEAIAMAGQLAKERDIVLIAGKGHEDYQEIQGKRYPFNDFELAQQFFSKTD